MRRLTQPSHVKGEEIIVFPDGHPDKDTLAIIKEGWRNVNASGGSERDQRFIFLKIRDFS
jgi:hypothetical protein